jgi:hypothetical protein
MNDDKLRFGRADDRLDRAIDRAVRTMMQVDPPPGLRRRIDARLAASPERAWPMSYAFAIAAVFVVAVALGLMLVQSGGQPGTGASPQATPVQQAAVPAPPPAVAPPAAAPAPAPPAPGTRAASKDRPRAGSIPLPRIGNIFGEPSGRVASASIERADDAASEVPADRTAAANPGSQTLGGPAPLHIAPLEVKPLQVAPLAPPRR